MPKPKACCEICGDKVATYKDFHKIKQKEIFFCKECYEATKEDGNIGR